jgi:hypothetical protein
VPALRAGRNLGLVTSPDGGGSRHSDHRADGSADSNVSGGDPAHLTPPVDPWSGETPPPVVADDTPVRGFGATGEVPPDRVEGVAAYGGVASGRPEGPRRRRWVPVVLAGGALFVAGTLMPSPFGSGDEDDARGSDPSAAVTVVPTVSPAAQPATSAVAAAVVVYEVTASGSRNTGSVSYTDQDGDIIRRSGIPLPWRVTFRVGAQRKPLVLIAQRKGGGDGGPVTCTITAGGKLLASTTATGKYAAPQCSGSGWSG